MARNGSDKEANKRFHEKENNKQSQRSIKYKPQIRMTKEIKEPKKNWKPLQDWLKIIGILVVVIYFVHSCNSEKEQQVVYVAKMTKPSPADWQSKASHDSSLFIAQGYRLIEAIKLTPGETSKKKHFDHHLELIKTAPLTEIVYFRNGSSQVFERDDMSDYTISVGDERNYGLQWVAKKTSVTILLFAK